MKIILRTLIIFLIVLLIGIFSAMGFNFKAFVPNPLLIMLGLMTMSLIGIFIVLLKKL